jgi:ribonuclease Y
MSTLGIIVIEAVVALIVAAMVGWIGYRLGRQRAKDEGAYLRVEAEKTLSEAQAKARQMLVEAKDEIIKLRDDFDQELRTRRQEIQREEDRLKKRREELDSQRDRLEQREKKLNQRQATLDKREAELERTYKERIVKLEAKLEEVAGMTREDARNTLLEIVRNEARNDMARIIREVEAEAQEMAEQRAPQAGHRDHAAGGHRCGGRARHHHH